MAATCTEYVGRKRPDHTYDRWGGMVTLGVSVGGRLKGGGRIMEKWSCGRSK